MNFFDELWQDVFALIILLVFAVMIYAKYKKITFIEVYKQIKELDKNE